MDFCVFVDGIVELCILFYGISKSFSYRID